MNFADIILPLAQPCYTFAVSHIPDLMVGEAVVVQFGKNSLYTGIVMRLHNDPPKSGKVKPVLKRLYDFPILTDFQIRFWSWMAEYYMSTIGEVMRVALPSLVKPHANTEELYNPYNLPQERVLRIVAMPDTEAFAKLSRRAPRRAELLEQLQNAGGEMPRQMCSADAATISALVKAGIIDIYERDSAPQLRPITQSALPTLSVEQNAALQAIDRGLEVRNVALLHGVTSSGKTEIYTHYIARALERGEDVLLLVPEISLTAQLVERMRLIFSDRVIAYHSKLTAARRTQIYMDMLRAPAGNFIVGARSALFLP